MRPRDARGVSPVVATILLVAITVVVAAVVYLMATGFGQNIAAPPPPIALQEIPTGQANRVKVEVAATGPQTYGYERFQLYLVVNATVDAGSTMDPLAPGRSGNVTLTDVNEDGRLTSGDFFMIDVAPATTYKLIIQWKETAGTSGSLDWTT